MKIAKTNAAAIALINLDMINPALFPLFGSVMSRQWKYGRDILLYSGQNKNFCKGHKDPGELFIFENGAVPNRTAEMDTVHLFFQLIGTSLGVRPLVKYSENSRAASSHSAAHCLV